MLMARLVRLVQQEGKGLRRVGFEAKLGENGIHF